jgi:hypothetical protein
MKRIWALAALCLIPGVHAAAATVDLVCTYTNGSFDRRTVPLVGDGDVLRFRWKPADMPPALKHVEVRAEFATARAGEDGYFVMPNGHLGGFREQEGEHALAGNCMPIFGMKTPRSTFVAIVTGLPHDYTLVAQARKGVYALFPRFVFGGRASKSDLAIDFHLLAGDRADYSGMARTYRAHQLNRKACVPLKERIAQSPELAYAARCVEVRIRQGWKPAPSPLEEQTPETEPPMRAVVTFDRVGRILDEFKRQGLGRAEICLVGWNRKGHDGRYPQLFPVEEALGGETRLRELIAKAHAMGFQIVCHNNHSDAYRISELWDEEYVIRNPDRSLSTNAVWSGGRMYNVCPRRAYERFVPGDLRAIADLGFRGVHYIDVLTIVKPRACFDPRHPLTSDESAEWINRIMGEAKRVFGGVSSEGPWDFCCGNLDYALYVSFGGLSKPLPPMVDRIVPFWQLVYHGIIMSNPFTDTTNYTIKDDVARLKLVEFGGRPMFYFHSKFLEGNKQWMGAEDLTCETDEALAAAVARIKEGSDEYDRLAHLQTEFMDRHEEIAADVVRTTYSDGTAVVVNHRATAFDLGGRRVPARTYVVVK